MGLLLLNVILLRVSNKHCLLSFFFIMILTSRTSKVTLMICNMNDYYGTCNTKDYYDGNT